MELWTLHILAAAFRLTDAYGILTTLNERSAFPAQQKAFPRLTNNGLDKRQPEPVDPTFYNFTIPMPTALVPVQSVTKGIPGIGGSTGDVPRNEDGLPLDPCGVDKGKYDGGMWATPLGNSKGITYELHCDSALATDWSVKIIHSQDDPDSAISNEVCMKNCDGWKGCKGVMEATPELCVMAIGSYANLVEYPGCSTWVPIYGTPGRRDLPTANVQRQVGQYSISSRNVAANGFQFFDEKLEVTETAAAPTKRQDDVDPTLSARPLRPLGNICEVLFAGDMREACEAMNVLHPPQGNRNEALVSASITTADQPSKSLIIDICNIVLSAESNKQDCIDQGLANLPQINTVATPLPQRQRIKRQTKPDPDAHQTDCFYHGGYADYNSIDKAIHGFCNNNDGGNVKSGEWFSKTYHVGGHDIMLSIHNLDPKHEHLITLNHCVWGFGYIVEDCAGGEGHPTFGGYTMQYNRKLTYVLGVGGNAPNCYLDGTSDPSDCPPPGRR
ncbi:hypothetical protein KC333_g3193 [Hortaea werneckii]|nr:hypothetical protein KC333_g3193 [Hortaea werneckii]KAI7322957.1 hypothetical protein KC326_g1709 [Hortaea werneckii]